MRAELDNITRLTFRAERAMSVAVSSGNAIHQTAVEVAYDLPRRTVCVSTTSSS